VVGAAAIQAILDETLPTEARPGIAAIDTETDPSAGGSNHAGGNI